MSVITPMISVIKGTGAKGLPVAHGLVFDKRNRCRVLTQDPDSHRAKALTALPNVSLLDGTFANEMTL